MPPQADVNNNMNSMPDRRAFRLVNMFLLLMIDFVNSIDNEQQVGVPVVRKDSCQFISPPFGKKEIIEMYGAYVLTMA
jgi:hypothetical protein